MKTTIQSILVATVLVTASASGMAASVEPAATNGATSVVEMMQKKHEHQLRAQLVAEGRWNEVRQLDENDAAQVRDDQESRYTKANEALAHGSNAKVQDEDHLLNQCDPGKLRL